MNPKTAAQSKLDIARAYRGLMLTEQGDIKPEAEIILRDLEKQCGWMVDAAPVDNTGAVDTHRMSGMWFKRQTYAHIKKRLFEPLDKYVKTVERESH